MNTNEAAAELATLTDEEFEARAATHWTNHSQIIRGKSNRAADNSWSMYDLIRAERARRTASKGA